MLIPLLIGGAVLVYVPVMKEMFGEDARADADAEPEDFPVDLGGKLYFGLFKTGEGTVGAHFSKCCGATLHRTHHGVRVRLRADEPRLAALPWEFLYSRGDRRFLATDVAMLAPVRSIETTP